MHKALVAAFEVEAQGLKFQIARARAAGEESQSVLTWPEGNGRIADYLADRVGSRLRCSTAVSEIAPLAPTDDQGALRVDALSISDQRVIGIRAEQVVLAAPQFLVPHLVAKVVYESHMPIQMRT